MQLPMCPWKGAAHQDRETDAARFRAGVQIRDGNEDSVVFAYNAPVALSNTQFHGNNCTDGMIGGTFVSAGVIKIGSVTSVRLGDSSAMTTTEGWEVLLEEKNSTLYTDTMPNGAERPRANPASKGQVLPLSELPAQYTPRTAFLTLDDEDYKRIKQVRPQRQCSDSCEGVLWLRVRRLLNSCRRRSLPQRMLRPWIARPKTAVRHPPEAAVGTEVSRTAS